MENVSIISPTNPYKHLLCPACGGRLFFGSCKNPLCHARVAAPGVPSPENRWAWAVPAVRTPLCKASMKWRRSVGIPADATVWVTVRDQVLEVEWFDDRNWLAVIDGSEFLHIGGEHLAAVLEFCDNPAETGFVLFDDATEFYLRLARSVIINPLPLVDESLQLVPSDYEPLLPGYDESVDIFFSASYSSYMVKGSRWTELERKKRKLIADLKSLSEVDDFNEIVLFVKTPEYRDSNEMSCRNFAAHCGIHNLGGCDHHPAAYKLAFRLGITLVGANFFPLMPPRKGHGDPNNIWDYRINDMPIMGFVFDMNKHTGFFYPDLPYWEDGLIPAAIGNSRFIFESQNIFSFDLFDWSDLLDVQFYNRDFSELQLKKALEVVLDLKNRLGLPDHEVVVVDYNLFNKVPDYAAISASNITELGHKYLNDIVFPFRRIASMTSADMLPHNLTSAAESLLTAARSMRNLGYIIGLPGDLVEDLNKTIAILDSESEQYQQSIGRVISMSVDILLHIHVALYINLMEYKRTTELFGEDFCRVFSSGEAG